MALLKSIETGATEPFGIVDAHAYKQHNLGAEDGVEGFTKLLQALPRGSAKVHTVRVFEDGEYVVAHSDYDFFGPKAGFDIFRFQHGRIVERWDNLQEQPSTPNPSGHTMLDGSTAVTDLEKADENKRLVCSFFDEVTVGDRVAASPRSTPGPSRRVATRVYALAERPS